MEQTLSRQAADWREGRRLRAYELKQEGWKQERIAEALGVTGGAVSQWMTRAKEGGIEALRHRKHAGPNQWISTLFRAGPKPKLTTEQRAQLPGLLVKGPEAFGFRGALWTQPRVAKVIHREFGVQNHSSQVGRILKECGWTRQKPVRRATQRDEEAIRRWKEERWPEVKKGG